MEKIYAYDMPIFQEKTEDEYAGLDARTLNALWAQKPQQISLFDFLKDKSKDDIFLMRGIGAKGFALIKKWLFNHPRVIHKQDEEESECSNTERHQKDIISLRQQYDSVCKMHNDKIDQLEQALRDLISVYELTADKGAMALQIAEAKKLLGEDEQHE